MTGRRGRGRGASKAPGASASHSPPGASRRSAQGDAATPAMPAPASAQVSRVTRSQSQSRDAEAEPQVEVPRRGTRRNVREQSVQSIRSNTSRVTSVDFALSQPQSQSQGVLDTVAEEPGSTPRAAQRPASPPPRRSSARGSVELTPGRGTARPKLRTRFFESLFRAADDLQRHHSDRSAEDEDDEETWTLVHGSYKAAFGAIRAPISRAVAATDHYMPLDNALGAIIGDEVDPQDALTSVAAGNVATLLEDLFGAEIAPLLDDVDSVFPTAFMPASVPALARWLEADLATLVKLALDIRTQRFIAYLRGADRGPDSDPIIELSLLFCDEDAVQAALQDSNDGRAWNWLLGQGPYRNFDGLDLDVNDDDKLREAYHTRLASIRSLLTGEDEHVDLAQLEDAFPWEAVAESLRSWATSCFDAIKTSRFNKTAGSSPSLFVDAPDHQHEGSEELGSQVESQPVHRGPESQTGPRALDANDVGILMQLERDPASEIPASDSASAIDFNNEDLVRRSKILSSQKTQNPPRSSVPRPGNHGALYYSAAAAATDRKRAFEPTFEPGQFDDDDDDDEFEQDSRVPNLQRRAHVAVAAGPAPKKVRIDEQRFAPQPPRPSSYAASALQASNPGGAVPSSSALPPPPPYNHPDLATLSQMSRQQSLLHRKPRAPQTRHRWSPHDMDLLILAVDAYKAKWSVIERAGTEGLLRFEQPRDQQGLRDKARNIKVDLLKTNSVLPPSFDLVVLGKKERQAVIDVGKNPDRKEADIVNGLPVNLQYHEDPFA